jgi:hypothetical protein
MWLCLCDCGNYTMRSRGTLRQSVLLKYYANCGCEKKNDIIIDSNSGRHMCSKCKEYPMTPYNQRIKPTSGICSRCTKAYGVSNRSKRWEAGERPLCKNHPCTFVNKSFWIHKGSKYCAKCIRDMRNPEYDKIRYLKRRNEESYKEYQKYYSLSRRKTLKLRNHGN